MNGCYYNKEVDDLTTVYLSGFYDGEKKWKDKIKAKIEFIKSLKEKLYYEENVISILQSLVEREEKEDE